MLTQDEEFLKELEVRANAEKWQHIRAAIIEPVELLRLISLARTPSPTEGEVPERPKSCRYWDEGNDWKQSTMLCLAEDVTSYADRMESLLRDARSDNSLLKESLAVFQDSTLKEAKRAEDAEAKLQMLQKEREWVSASSAG